MRRTTVHHAAPQPRIATAPNHTRWCPHTSPNNVTWVARSRDRVCGLMMMSVCVARGVCAECLVKSVADFDVFIYVITCTI
jgi:hypothetical protein